MKTFFTSVLMLTAASVLAQNYSGDSWSAVKASKSGTISLAYVETPSFVYKDKAGNLTGICVDIMNDFKDWVSTTKGVKLTTKFVGDGTSFRGMYDKTKAGDGGVFGLGNVTITEERKKEVKFTPPIITNNAILVTQPTVPTLAKLEDISKTFAGFYSLHGKGHAE
jgi:ABC-type amino acid transport substrate-binding protein